MRRQSAGSPTMQFNSRPVTVIDDDEDPIQFITVRLERLN